MRLKIEKKCTCNVGRRINEQGKKSSTMLKQVQTFCHFAYKNVRQWMGEMESNYINGTLWVRTLSDLFNENAMPSASLFIQYADESHSTKIARREGTFNKIITLQKAFS